MASRVAGRSAGRGGRVAEGRLPSRDPRRGMGGRASHARASHGVHVDPDNGPSPLSFRWTQAAGPRVKLKGATTATPTFKPRGPGMYLFNLVVHDGNVGSAPDSVKVTAARPRHHGYHANDDDDDDGDDE